jgi:multimeric flavodoxin WrbA
MKILLIGCSLNNNSNSEICLREAERGIKELGIETEYLFLNKYFLADGSKADVRSAIEKVRESDGLIFSTPVYFGDCSSLMFEFIECLKLRKINLYKKVVGFCVVGAKRNGGQETTIEWNAWDIMGLGACVVNDGAPISQFGGVVVANDHGTAENDKEGMAVCRYLGKRVAETALILKSGNLKEKVNIQKWDMRSILNDYDLHRCFACLNGSDCPLKIEDDFKCRNKQDDMKKLHLVLMQADGVVPSNLQMRFVERTRYLRRDNYRLTYHVVKMTSPRFIHIFIKENSILCRKYLNRYAHLVSSGKKKLSLNSQEYRAKI